MSLATAMSTQAVAVDVERGDRQGLGQGGLQVGRPDLDAGLLADVGEPAAVVPQQGAERARERRQGDHKPFPVR